jgi:hypothetical protein
MKTSRQTPKIHWESVGRRAFGSAIPLGKVLTNHESVNAHIIAGYEKAGGTKPLFMREFPSFDPTSLPDIPEGFEDISWHNDACPSFLNKKAGLRLFVDYPDYPRETANGFRFTLCHADEDGDCGAGIVQTEDWADVTAAIAEVSK